MRELQLGARCWVLWSCSLARLVLIRHSYLQRGITTLLHRYWMRYNTSGGM